MLLLIRPGVQSVQSVSRWCCGTVRYAVREEMLVLVGFVRRFSGNMTFGWHELSGNMEHQEKRCCRYLITPVFISIHPDDVQSNV